MSADRVRTVLAAYAKAVRDDLRANPTIRGDAAAIEPLLQLRFRSLVEDLLPLVFPQSSPATLPRVLVEYSKKTIGRPDIAFARRGSFARSFIELKAPSKSLRPARLTGHDKEQFQRFCNLPTWAYSNFHEVHLYARDALQQQATIVPVKALEPETADARADRLIAAADSQPFLQIVESLVLAQPVAPKSPKEVAVTVAYAARLVKDVVWDLARRLSAGPESEHDPIYSVREDFRDILYARPTAGGHGTEEEFDQLFASAFAQTLAYGLLLAREGNGGDIGFDAHDKLDGNIHPLLKVTLQALLTTQVREDLGSSLDVLLDTVNAVDPALMKRRAGYDPILYFYEDFLAVFDANMRTRYGVFFTPVEVVEYQVAAVDRALRHGLETEGLLDERVLLLDPGCGTGTYLIYAAGAAAESASRKYGAAAVPSEIRSLADRLFGFEILVGPYTVAHYRLHKELDSIGAKLASRLHIYLTDTLAPAHAMVGVTPHLGFMSAPIVKEREEADEVKSQTPILAIMGNPPYRRLAEGETEELVGRWVADQLWEDFKKPVRDAGWGGELNTFPDLYVAFYRWALWKLFERPGADGRGVLSFISNRTFLTGHPYAGVRQCLRRLFDRIEILDLRGDRRGARPAGIEHDENVFNIETGVCILTAWASGKKPAEAEAEVYYADIWEHGAFTEAEKRAVMKETAGNPARIRMVRVQRSGLEDFRPEPFAGEHWIALNRIFHDSALGVQTKRDTLVYGISKADLANKIKLFLSTTDPEAAKETFHETGMRRAGDAQRVPFSERYVEPVAYRPFDVRYLYSAEAYIDRPRPALTRMWGDSNTCLYAMPSGTGAGPAVFVHGLKPDYHAFSNRGGYAFPLYDRRPGGHLSNIEAKLIDAVSRAYKSSVAPEDVFDFIVALLSAPSYSHRFAADLEDAFPHVAFPRTGKVFREGVAIGRHIRELQTLAKQPEAKFQTARLQGNPKDYVLDTPPPGRAWRDTGAGRGTIILKSDGTLRLENVAVDTWSFSISGFQVVYKWLYYRNGQVLDKAMQRQLLDLVARIAELCSVLPAADRILEKTLADPLPGLQVGV